VAETLESHRGLLALAGEQPVGAMLLAPDGHLLRMRRVSVHPEAQNAGVAVAMIGTAERIAAEEGYDGLVLGARAELPSTGEHLARFFTGGLFKKRDDKKR
jgi:ribosomal protein S18 acetylase RimI-like enzyme